MGQITKGQGIELLNKSLPYPHQIESIDLDISDSIYFTWRDERFKLCLRSLSVYKSDGTFLEVGNTAILIRELINKTRTIQAMQ